MKRKLSEVTADAQEGEPTTKQLLGMIQTMAKNQGTLIKIVNMQQEAIKEEFRLRREERRQRRYIMYLLAKRMDDLEKQIVTELQFASRNNL